MQKKQSMIRNANTMGMLLMNLGTGSNQNAVWDRAGGLMLTNSRTTAATPQIAARRRPRSDRR